MSRVLQKDVLGSPALWRDSEGGQPSAVLVELGDAQELWDELRAQTCWGDNLGCVLSPGVEREAKG